MHDRQRSRRRAPNVKRPNDSIHATRCDNGIVVLVPVVSENFCGWATRRQARIDTWLCASGMNGDRRDEVVLGGGWGAEIINSKVGVGRDGGY